MFSAGVFVPGVRRLTNQMLSDLRAAGVFEGRAKEIGRRPKPGHDLFAAEVDAVKWASFAAWKDWRASHRDEVLAGELSVRFFVVGHRGHDPDSWYLLAKPAIDGMVKALGLSDRFDVNDVGGRVARKGGETWWPGFGEGEDGEQRVNDGRAGFWMDVCAWGVP